MDAKNENVSALLSATTGLEETNNSATKITVNVIEDIALWPEILSQESIDHFILNKPKNIGKMNNITSLYKDKGRTYYRSLRNEHFYRIKANGLKENRDWLIFSETGKAVYCYVCRMFSKSLVKSKFTTGFQNWKIISTALVKHETSKEHISSMCTLFRRSSSEINRVDAHVLKQAKIQEKYWRDVLRRVISTIKLIASLGLPFRGHDESENSARKGNFLTCLNYLCEYDEFLKMHFEKYASCGQGTANYLSHKTCDEFISIIHDQVRTQIVDEIKNANYYSIILDSTPDISHEDQLTFVMRYLLPSGEIIERFLCFLSIERHDAQYLADQVLKTLNQLGIDIKQCRGQTYDNAANMAGKYSGLQARLQQHSSTAFFLPCASHSLNLIGNFAAESSSTAIRYFLFIQNLFVFFSVSTHRWNILQKTIEEFGTPVLKKLVDTRWSARADAVYAVKLGYKSIKQSLLKICNDNSEKKITIVEAKKLAGNFDDYDTALMTVIWNRILQRINSTSKSLQSVACNVIDGTKLLSSLGEFIKNIREDFVVIEKEAKELTSNNTYTQENRRVKKRKKFADETVDEPDTEFSARQNFICNTFYVICDNISSEIMRRSEAYKNIQENFEIFFSLNLENSLKKKCSERLKTIYKNDIDSEMFDDELDHFLLFAKEENKSSVIEMYNLAFAMKTTFPNVEIILRILLTMPISNASGERSFSVLKRVKNYQRNSMTDHRLNCLSLLYIENEILNNINCNVIIDKFARDKCRKRPI